jgi:hypothetical protein
MKNVTISMGETTLTWVRIQAAQTGLSVSRWIAQDLESRRRATDEKAAAGARIEQLLRDFPGLPLSEGGKITIDRDEMYGDRFQRFDHPALPAGSDGPDQGRDLRSVAEDPQG